VVAKNSSHCPLLLRPRSKVIVVSTQSGRKGAGQDIPDDDRGPLGGVHADDQRPLLRAHVEAEFAA